MKVIGLRTKLKAKEHSGMLKVTYMLESFWRIRHVGSVSTLMSMEVGMKVSPQNPKTLIFKDLKKWVNDVQQGQGEETWVDGAKYVGQYKDGMKNGYGVYVWADRSEFKGNWMENKITGYGIYTWEDG